MYCWRSEPVLAYWLQSKLLNPMLSLQHNTAKFFPLFVFSQLGSMRNWSRCQTGVLGNVIWGQLRGMCQECRGAFLAVPCLCFKTVLRLGFSLHFSGPLWTLHHGVWASQKLICLGRAISSDFSGSHRWQRRGETGQGVTCGLTCRVTYIHICPKCLLFLLW